MKLSMLQRMQDKGAKLLNSVHSMELCNDKLMSQVTLNTAGIKTPYSFTLQNPDDVEKVIEFMEKSKRLKYPTVVKTLRGTHGIGVMKIDSRASLVSVTQMLLKEGIEFMIQEFLEHDQSARIIMIGDQVLAANLRGQAKDKDEFRTNSHLGSETEPYNPPDDEVAIGRKIVQLFGCNFCAIDYIVLNKDSEEKQIIVLEVNGSPGLEAISKNWPDRNLPRDVIAFATKQPEAKPAEVPAEMTDMIDAVLGVADLEEPVAPEVPMPDVPDVQPPETTDEIQEVEPIDIHRIADGLEARVDTGAALSSIHVDKAEFEKGGDRVKFKIGDVTYTAALSRTIKIKNVHGGDATRRAVIKLDMTIHGHRVNGVEFTLTDRSNMKYPVLVGRNILERLGLAVKVTKNTEVDSDVPESEIDEVEEE
jgi:RimK family alpha-L-glutamate ligase